MPELPEVEQFRRLLLPLVSKNQSTPIRISLLNDNTAKRFLTPTEISEISDKYFCSDVIRKGKQLCLALRKCTDKSIMSYLFIHMGMTGHITSPGKFCKWGHEGKEINEEEFPPRFTYLTFQCDNYIAAFSDPRKFGNTYLADSLDDLDELAHDALNCRDHSTIQTQILPRLTYSPTSIKALLLDQKRVVCGVGNWVADEVLYQCEIHPDQQYLTPDQAKMLFERLQEILQVAVDCLTKDQPYPSHWLFGYRWTKKKAGQDHAGRSLTFLTSGGRTSAIVASIQRLNKTQGKEASSAKPNAKSKDRATKATKTVVKRKSKSSKVLHGTLQSPNETQREDQSPGTRRRSPRLVSP